jgi:ribonuclease HII
MGRGSTNPKFVCGVDEAGRGPLAGPVVAAAVVFDKAVEIEGLTDSKLLSPAKRQKLFPIIIEKAAGYSIAGVSNSIIDKINILQATFLAMRQAVEGLSVTPDIIYVDGNKTIPGLTINQRAIIGGDRTMPEISAASILAKVTRDNYMTAYAELYPQYQFEKHKGYGTADHIKLLNMFGPCEIHRLSFNPVSQFSLWGFNNSTVPITNLNTKLIK